LAKELERLSYTCLTVATATVGKDSHGKTWADDVVAIMAVAQPLFDEGKEVIIIGHSYGGLPTVAATKDQTTVDRASRGEIGGFKQLILLAAYVIPERGSDLRSLGEKYPDWTEWQPEYTKVKLYPYLQWLPVSDQNSLIEQVNSPQRRSKGHSLQ
jgi:hypothetical protein